MRVVKLLLTTVGLCLVTLPISAGGQTKCVNIKFEIDGREVTSEKYKLLIEADGQTMEPKLLENGFAVPPEVSNWRDIQLRFVVREYDLLFNNLTRYHFDSEWVIGVNNPPFKESDTISASQEGKELKLIYYIEFHPKNAEGTRWVTRVYK